MSFTGRVISKKHPEIEKLFLKPASKSTMDKVNSGKTSKKGTAISAKGKTATTTTKKTKGGKEAAGKAKIIKSAKTKSGDGEDGVGKKSADSNGASKKNKSKAHDTSKSAKDMASGSEAQNPEDAAAAAAFEAWCQKQNRHFDDCESFELSIEIECTE